MRGWQRGEFVGSRWVDLDESDPVAGLPLLPEWWEWQRHRERALFAADVEPVEPVDE